MASLEIIGEPSHRELEALTKLARLLPDDWLITSRLRDVEGRELDAVVVAPTGIACLELKGWKGLIHPKGHGPWMLDGRTDHDQKKNPLEQGDMGSKKLASYLKGRFSSERFPAFVEYLVVLTDPSAKLDVTDTTLSDKDRRRVCLLDSAPGALRGLFGHRIRLTPHTQRNVLDLLRNPGRAVADEPQDRAGDDIKSQAEYTWDIEEHYGGPSWAEVDALRKRLRAQRLSTRGPTREEVQELRSRIAKRRDLT